jgi:hypothetical protein
MAASAQLTFVQDGDRESSGQIAESKAIPVLGRGSRRRAESAITKWMPDDLCWRDVFPVPRH